MKIAIRSALMAATLAAMVFSLTATPAWAGPEEDYAEGTKHNLRGDVFASLPLLRRAADAGHAGAQAALGELMRSTDFGAEALDYFTRSAAQGNADGQYGLAGLLASGEGTTKNTGEAFKLLKLAAFQGHARAIDAVAFAYLTGGMDVSAEERRSPEALQWIRQSADGGYASSMQGLANAYRTGDYGLPVDAKLAGQWAEKVRKLSGKPERKKRSSKIVILEDK